MWTILVRFILRYRLVNLIIIILLTGFMSYQAMHVKLSFEHQEMLPAEDSTSINYHKFKDQFGEDGSVMFVAVQDSNIFQLNQFNDLYTLCEKLKKTEGIQEVISITRMYNLTRNDSTKKFDFKTVVNKKPESQTEVDSIKNLIYSLPFYDGLLFNKESHVFLIMITLNKEQVSFKNRVVLIKNIQKDVEAFTDKYGFDAHFSGLPYIRTITTEKIKKEFYLFIFLAGAVAVILLFLYFRSLKAVLIPLSIVGIGVMWVLGTMVLLGYKITLLTGVIPPLLIIVGVENCIFLMNKYHYEYSQHHNKIKAISRIVQRVGFATLLTNAATAAGFAAFIIIPNRLLREFGIVASINIMIMYVISLFLVPILLSYLSPPGKRQMKHLNNRFTVKIINLIVHAVTKKRRIIYIVTIVLLIIAVFGIIRLKPSGTVVDDISKKHPIYKDLVFFEQHFRGVMPLEITIDTKKKKGVMNPRVLEKISELQDTLATYPELSKPLSVAEVVKFARQAFYQGDPDYYGMPNGNEMVFMMSYIPKYNHSKKTILNNFADSILSITRISVQMANITTPEIRRIVDDLRPKCDSIFNKAYYDALRSNDTANMPVKYDINITGTSVVFQKGSEYLVSNLWSSLLWATIIISFLMLLMFTSLKMVGISMIANLLPQILTAALMGYLCIAIKPSTVLIFSIALGISVDNAILFLSRYRFQLKQKRWDINACVVSALKETGYSMIYTSSVLFFGFSIFIFSSFGGTQAIGYLISFTMLVAMLCNLFLLPSLLLTFGKKGTTKAFKEPVLHILEEDNSEEELNTKTNKNQNNPL